VTSPRFLAVRREGPVEYVALNRPDVRNAFNDELVGELSAWATSSTARTARVAVLSGAGKVFSAGADVAWMSKTIGHTREENIAGALEMTAMFQALDSLPLPLIGRVHGAALGGGAGLAAVCDIVVAAEDAVFGFSEVKLGILPSVIAPYALAKIGQSAARELFLTGARFSAARAREIGLVHRVVAEAELDAAVARYVDELLTSAPTGIAAAKGLLRKIVGHRPADVAQITAETIAAQRVSDEGQDGLRAFLEKRKAKWTL
jgi:methylglutaconyl-CoA hydratase